MAKFFYMHRINSSLWNEEISKVHKILGHIHDEPFIKTSSHEILWCSTEEGLKVNNWTLTTGNFSKDENQFTFRLNVKESEVELIPDQVASRTVWYYSDNERIIVSSSQRAIISLLGDFQLNKQAISWMICCGSLGPEHSWDIRIKSVTPNSIVVLSKHDSGINQHPISAIPIQSNLKECFSQVFSSWQISEETAMNLSGGWDSRATAFMLAKNNIYPTAYTWGTSESITIQGTDSSIAKKLAKKIGNPFKFIPLDRSSDQLNLLEKFVIESEGRIDHVNTFITGFGFWQQLKDDKIHSVIRSDEAFGWINSINDQDVRVSLEINHPDDYQNLKHVFEISGIEKPHWPKKFDQNPNESLPMWRDRLYREYRIPTILAALQEPMLSYVEIINPLLHHRFIDWSISQPDKNRTDKKHYKSLVKKWVDLPVATIPSIPEVESVLKEPSIVKEMEEQLSKQNSFFTFNDSFTRNLIGSLQKGQYTKLENVWIKKLKSMIPFRIKKLIRHHIKRYEIKNNRISFRAFLVLKMMEVIQNDLK